nr:efflux transporter outer membrane subunit [Paracandidimonas lactea]
MVSAWLTGADGLRPAIDVCRAGLAAQAAGGREEHVTDSWGSMNKASVSATTKGSGQGARRRSAAGRPVWVAALLALLAGCAVGPDYHRPDLEVGAAYKELPAQGAETRAPGSSAYGAAPVPEGQDAMSSGASTQAAGGGAFPGWVRAQPADTALPSEWWSLYADGVLSGLMARLAQGNFDIAQAEAKYRQARAALGAARAGLFPTVGTSASATRSGGGASGGGIGDVGNQYSLSGTLSWEVDLWGKVRRSVQASHAGFEASGADLAAARLSLQSTLAQSYFNLRMADVQFRLLAETVAAYERSLTTTQNRYAVGVAGQADVEAARVQLENARVQQLALAAQRAQLEHAIAVLVGVPPSQFALPEAPAVALAVPEIPVGLPSQLLQRRPDIAAAERRAAQANAQIGVAQAAWFPALTLSAQGGFRSGEWAQWLTAPARFWSLGPALALTVFDAGARSAQVEQARANFDAQAAVYRQTVLTALREVEDYLVALDALGREQVAQDRALAAARESLRLTQNQYDAGLIDYLSVVQVQTAALSAERSALQLRADRLVASAQLIAALGGGWDATALSTR